MDTLAVQVTKTKGHNPLGYQNEEIVHRIARENDSGIDRAREIFADTLRFLTLCGTWRGTVTPTKSIDIGWHTFLLFTRDYRQYCNGEFGLFIDHVPTPKLADPDVRSHRKSIGNTLAGARALFGDGIADRWAIEFNQAAAGCQECSPEPSCDTGSCCHDGNPG